MYIIGSGLAGCIAGIMNGGATILEGSKSLPDNHHGVLRFKTDKISKITGIPFTKVKVLKGIWYEGQERQLSARMANMYSKKVVGRFHERSILNIEPAIRYVAPENFHQLLGFMLQNRIYFNNKVESITKEHINVEQGWHRWERLGVPVISTIPMAILAKVTGISMTYETTQVCEITPVFISRMKIEGADIHQTIYYPDPEMGTYRASMVGDSLIVETMKDNLPGWELSAIKCSFGFSAAQVPHLGTAGLHKELGKLSPIPEKERRAFMFKASIELNIWSLGRYACWRPSVLLDDVYEDVLKIRLMIGTDHYNVKLSTIKKEE